MDEVPGAIRWLSWQELGGSGPWTHALSPQALNHFLVSELGCAMGLIGIQPAADEIAASLSPEVDEAVDTVVLSLLRLLARD
jgi:Ni,Fe-hydrogenase maturation factor